jgi:pimeloyl-ACP methyl ester carboxylesterase
MPFATINSVRINYEVLGNSGPWVALVSGARRNMDEVRGLATLVAAAGFRVLLHDRRNTGLSGLSLEGQGSEFEIWADDLRELVRELGISRLVVGGSSSGCRLATILALRHRDVIAGLLMMRVTGGAFAVKRLSQVYYGQYIEAVQHGGMAAVCDTDHFSDLIALDATRREQIMGWDPKHFVEIMSRWRANLESGVNDPMLGGTKAALKAIDFPVCVIPGNDRTHAIDVGVRVHGLIPGAELHEMRKDQLEADLIPMEEWVPNQKLAPVVLGFLKRAAATEARVNIREE